MGSSEPTPCPIGYYLDATEQSANTSCKICTKGMFCQHDGLPTPSGDCQRGYYCPEGQITATPGDYTCPQGHFCGTGYGDPEPCPSGTYQDTDGRWDCKVCPVGR